MDIDGWSYYNHAAVPSNAPHEEPNIVPLKTGLIWRMKGYPLFARWTTNWDCKYETNWWYVIKDTPFSMEDVKSKIRTKIRKGLKNYECREINAEPHADEICKVFMAANASYDITLSKKYRIEDTVNEIKGWTDNIRVWGAFNNENQLCAYTTVEDKGTYFKMIGHKSLPESERSQVNAALLYQMLLDLNREIGLGKYVCNGERSVNHDTNFNNYLEEYFGYRKSYCQLNIKWRKWVGVLVGLLYHFRERLKRHSKNKLIHSIYSLLYMKSILSEDRMSAKADRNA